ncbi:DUF2000 family protein [Aquitalea sp.]|uniref:DUF2000 family protein n=1 Tax=Aquitalea sp. TaxID=1872623 RepID=UPI002587FB07|nr:DUF2000 family protein [Aquitalea sp.]
MHYEVTSDKFIIVLNRRHDPAVLFNACAHLCIGLGSRLGYKSAVLPYPVPAIGVTSMISAYPVIVLEAKSSTQLFNLLLRTREIPSLVCNMFTTSMLGASAAEQIAHTEALTAQTAEIVAVGLFGEKREIEAVTKKFSLYKARMLAEDAEAP